ncbi:hypothetical protein SAMN05421693_10449 [Ectothiorhodospira magna]|uniref:Uncharacterized protein n=2 Tax=Ectothiorhodospira magna TaxID=867345 RepID=A0A1H9A6X4_9GAMM|nr:hypothetical protein SAMN05421693_10449 [Ectothiorhodospira magna]
MKKTAALLMAAWLVAGCSPTTEEQSFYGVWKIEGFTSTPAAGVAEEQAQKILGQTSVYSKHIAHFKEIQCLKPSYVVKTLSEDEFKNQHGIHFESLGLTEETAKQIEITCFDHPMEDSMTLLPKGENELLIAWNGLFFEAHRKTGSPFSMR